MFHAFLIMIPYILNKPNPPKNPVINLLLLVDFFKPASCIYQSDPIIPIKTQHILKETGFFIINSMTAIKWPIKTPVHLAQTGNCFPL